MKKLMITLSAAALATSVFANEDTPTMYHETEGFETYEAETTVIKTDTPTEAGGSTMLWYSAGADGETGTVKAYGENDGKLEGAGNQYLNVETTTGTPLYRKLVAHNAGDGVNQDSDRVDIGDGIYVDTYVQFTASEEAPAEIADSKLVVWVKETADEEAGTSTTNLMVMAGQLDASGVPTAQNFVIDTTGRDLAGWHRLTIRAMVAREADQNSIAAFTLFLDGVQLAAKATQVPGKDAVLDEGGVEVEPAVDPVTYETLMGAYAVANLSAEAQKFYQNKQLFYSLVGTDQSGIVKQISAVGFDGSGQIDNVTTTTAAPGFARGYFTLSWDNGLSKIEVYNGEVLVEQFENLEGAGNGVFAIGEGMEQVTVKCTKANSEYTIVGANEDGEITFDVEAKAYAIVVESTLVMIDNASYSSLAAALDKAESGAELTLVKDITDLSEMTIDKDIIINLNGNDLVYKPTDGEGNPYLFFVLPNASLKIYDSVGGGSVMCAEGYEEIVELVIYAESAAEEGDKAGSFILGDLMSDKDKGATIIGGIAGESLSFIQGTIVDMLGVFGGDIESYLYADELGNKSVATYDEETQTYVITPSAGGEEPEPTTFVVTVSGGDNAAYAVTGADDLNAVVSGTELTFTATANEGYTYEGATLGDWTIDENDATKATYTVIVNDNLTVEVPAAVEVADETFDVKVTGNEKATYTSNPAKLTGLTAGTTVTITATAKTGYTYDGADAAEGWSFDGQTATYTARIADVDISVAIPVPVLVKAAFGDTEYATEEDAQTAKNSFQAPAGVDGDIFSVEVVGTKVTVTLNEEVVKTSADTVAKAVGEALAKVLDGTAAIEGITLTNVKSGLEYAVASAIELKDLNSVEPADGDYVKAQGGMVTLKVNKPSDSKGFFKIKVKYSGK